MNESVINLFRWDH